ncbi:MAG: MG2 domain-containing protein [Polyangiaceae bacterium]|nr:MG2 domain-containing protein [Polyangiaceae bacterium]
MNRQAAFALAGLVTTITLAMTFTQACRRHYEAPPIGIEVRPQGPLVFPPPDEGWSDRAPLPHGLSHPTRRYGDVRLFSPVIDDKDHFEIEGDTLRFYFSDYLFGDDDLKKAPNIQISPAVKGKTVWDTGSSVEFRAQGPFDPDVEYTVTLPAVTGPSEHVFEGLKATFKATPAIEIGGKTIHYIPKPGEARAIAVLPRTDKIGAQEITVLYDQPLDLALASRLVTLADKENNTIPASIVHPGKTTLDGQKIDPRMLLVVKPKTRGEPGTEIKIAAAAEKSEGEDKTITHTYEIAKPTTLLSIGCSGERDCETRGTNFLKASHTSSIEVKYSNPLGIGWDVKSVRITPKPANLYVNAYDSLTINGSFAPSTTYTVHIDAMRDRYDGSVPPTTFTFQTRPLPASATLPEGVSLVDGTSIKAFPITTRNVAKADLLLWPLPKGDAAAFTQALADAKTSKTPDTPPVTIALLPIVKRNALVETSLDLSKALEIGRAYVGTIKITETLTDARLPTFPQGSDASHPAVALLFAAGPNAIGAHVHHAGDKAVVQVFRLANGEPVAGAKITSGGTQGTTDDSGSALIPVASPTNAAQENDPETTVGMAISAGDAELVMPLSGHAVIPSSSLFPDLHKGFVDQGAGDVLGMIVTDRGIYRPGSKLFLKAFTRKLEPTRISPLPHAKVRLRIIDPTDTSVVDDALDTGERGWINREIALDKTWHTGPYNVKLELDDTAHTVIAEQTVRVAEFVAPKFKVDVESRNDTPANKVQALVRGRYLFGAPMSEAHLTWTITKKAAPVHGGALEDAGLSFGRESFDWYEAEPNDAFRPITGEGTLEKDGTFAIDAELGTLAPQGPTEILVEASVHDASSRYVNGQYRTVKDPFTRHAGLNLSRRFGGAGTPLRVDLGVVDSAGNTVVGAPVKARIERLVWTRTAEKAESGATIERWKNVATTVGACEVVSAKKPASCELPVNNGGSYRVTTSIDGRDDASSSFWAYGRWKEGERNAVPSAGKTVPLVLERAHYKSGETAKLLVQSPYAKATALLTVEQGSIMRHETKRVEGPSVTFDIPVSASNAPWMNAVVTLLPMGETEADYRVGAVRIPVEAEEAKLDVHVSSSKKQYEAKDNAEITIEVTKGGAPVKNADVTLAVVDEGVLRMTSFHAKDPSTDLRKGRALDFLIADSRNFMLARRDRAHVAGGGGAYRDEALDTRKNFVETAAWLPDLVTDDKGRVTAKVKLPDNLTEFRMMAVVIDEIGRGGSAESSFTVSKSLMLEPVMPRFALRGDTFEAAAMVHNNTDAPVQAKVTVADQVSDVTLLPHSNQRVSAKMTADRAGTRTMRFSLEAGGSLKDRVEIPLRIDVPGIDEHPVLSGAFTAGEQVSVAIPADAIFDDDAAMSIKAGSALYPELGQRLGYLLDYPHGCVEQTTSSLLPLLAARTILPWTGTAPMEDAEIRRRIEFGIERLATMETSGGGLAYWPGGDEPNAYGTAYAMLALLRAKEMGIEKPKLIERTTKYLVAQLEEGGEARLRVTIADILAKAKALPEATADSLYDTRDKLDSFGLGSLANALASLPKQEDRVKDVLDRLEASFDETGSTKLPLIPGDRFDARSWSYWGSPDRHRAQATIALSRLRKESKLLPVLARRLLERVERWNTQSTAWSLMALADNIGAQSPNGGVDVEVRVDGKTQETFRRLGGNNKEVRVPLRELRGKTVTLTLKGDAKTASAFSMDARYKRPLGAAGTRLARRGPVGLSIHRAYSDTRGAAIDLTKVKAGDIVRVALRIEPSGIDSDRLGYVAITDRLPAGLEAIDPDLATTGSVPDIAKEHPFYRGLVRSWEVSHVDLRDEKVQIYFDQVGDFGRVGDGHAFYATYLARATTPGAFTLPPASGELMYEPGSEGYSDAGSVRVQ